MSSCKKQLKYNIAELAIKKLIADGCYQTGELIPSIRELAKELPFSEITLRHALNNLELSGIIRKITGVGMILLHPIYARSLKSNFLYLHIRSKNVVPMASAYSIYLSTFLAERGVAVRYLSVTIFEPVIQEMAEEVSGIIVSGTPDEQMLRELKSFRLPMILINCWENYSEIPALSFDAVKYSYDITCCFIKHGKTEIVFYDHSPGLRSDKFFGQGYLQAMNEAGLKPIIFHKENHPQWVLGDHLSNYHISNPPIEAILITPPELFQY